MYLSRTQKAITTAGALWCFVGYGCQHGRLDWSEECQNDFAQGVFCHCDDAPDNTRNCKDAYCCVQNPNWDPRCKNPCVGGATGAGGAVAAGGAATGGRPTGGATSTTTIPMPKVVLVESYAKPAGVLTGCQAFVVHYGFQNLGNAPADPPLADSANMPILKVLSGVEVAFQANAGWSSPLAPNGSYTRDEAITWPTSDPYDDASQRVQGIDPGVYYCTYSQKNYKVTISPATIAAGSVNIGSFKLEVQPPCTMPAGTFPTAPPSQTFGWCTARPDCPEAIECSTTTP